MARATQAPSRQAGSVVNAPLLSVVWFHIKTSIQNTYRYTSCGHILAHFACVCACVCVVRVLNVFRRNTTAYKGQDTTKDAFPRNDAAVLKLLSTRAHTHTHIM